MSKFIRVFAAGVLLAGLPMAALAQVNVNVQVQVVGNCSVSAPSNANFGSQAPLASTNYTATGSVTLTCNRGAAPLVTVSNGANPTGSTRRMRRRRRTANYVGYCDQAADDYGRRLHTSVPRIRRRYSAGHAARDRLAASAAFAASGGPRTVNLCFQTTLDQNTPVATYTDMVSGVGHVDLSPDERAGRSEGLLTLVLIAATASAVAASFGLSPTRVVDRSQ